MYRIILSSLIVAFLASCTTTNSSSKPNILVIMVDDLGYGDLSNYGAKDIKTPEIDTLMGQGLKFTDFTANCCVCSPSRAAFLTGQNQDMVGVPGVVRTHDKSNWGFFDPKATTLPQVLGKNGYRTSLIGKWHLGLKSPNTPNDRGFEEFHGFLGDMMDDYWEHRRHGIPYMYHNKKAIETRGTHATDLFTDWSIEELKKSKEDGRPFFQFLAYNAPHSPIHPPKDWLAKFKKNNPKATNLRANIGALIEHLDYSIGRVLKALDELGMSENTMVVFTSDNGGKHRYGASNGKLRSDKTHVYEGGLKVCTSVTWPGKVKAGGLTPFRGMTMDLFPTILDAAGIDYDGHLDGQSMIQEVTEGGQTPFDGRNQVYTWLQGYKKHALRKGDWKLIKDTEKSSYELYNMAKDPYESTDLAKTNTVKFKELMKIMSDYLAAADKVNWKRPSQLK